MSFVEDAGGVNWDVLGVKSGTRMALARVGSGGDVLTGHGAGVGVFRVSW